MRNVKVENGAALWRLTWLLLFTLGSATTGVVTEDFLISPQEIPIRTLSHSAHPYRVAEIQYSSYGASLKEISNSSENTTLSTHPRDVPIHAGVVCYEGVGCFSMQPPWRSALRPLPAPQPPAVVGTHFILVTRRNPRGVLIRPGMNVSVNETGFAPEKNIFFIVHDIATNSSSPWMIDLKDALLQQTDGNVFLTDWSPGSAGLFSYLQVASNARVVGVQITSLLEHLLGEHNVSLHNVHLIGFGVGAHVAAYAGKGIKAAGRLTALDPAQAAFEGFDRSVRLDSDDAAFVEVVHSDAKPAIPYLGAGMVDAVGDVDFYINGGVDQFECTMPHDLQVVNSLEDFANISAQYIYTREYCQHMRSVEVYIEAIRNRYCIFWGEPGAFMEPDPEDVIAGRPFNYVSSFFGECTVHNCAPLGLDTIKYPARGTLVIHMARRRPYCKPNRELDETMRKELAKFEATTIKSPVGKMNGSSSETIPSSPSPPTDQPPNALTGQTATLHV